MALFECVFLMVETTTSTSGLKGWGVGQFRLPEFGKSGTSGSDGGAQGTTEGRRGRNVGAETRYGGALGRSTFAVQHMTVRTVHGGKLAECTVGGTARQRPRVWSWTWRPQV
jgi:hypothetical protein